MFPQVEIYDLIFDATDMNKYRISHLLHLWSSYIIINMKMAHLRYTVNIADANDNLQQNA